MSSCHTFCWAYLFCFFPRSGTLRKCWNEDNPKNFEKKKKRICRKKNLRGPIFASANTSQILFAFIHFKEFPSHKETNKNFSIFFVSYQQRQITWTWMNLKERVLKTVQIEVIMLYTVENDTRKEIFHFSPMLHFYSL